MLRGGNQVYSSGWKWAVPYVWNGSAWKRASPYVWNGSAWQALGGAGTNMVFLLDKDNKYVLDKDNKNILVREA